MKTTSINQLNKLFTFQSRRTLSAFKIDTQFVSELFLNHQIEIAVHGPHLKLVGLPDMKVSTS